MVEDSTGKIEVNGSNIVISNGFIDLTQSDGSDGEDERDDNSGAGSYNDNDNDNEDELTKKKADDGGVAIVDDASLLELEAAETNQQVGTMGEQEIDEAVGIIKSADQQTNEGDEEAFEVKEGYSEESETDSWDNSDDDNDGPALRKSEIKELLLSKKDYLEEIGKIASFGRFKKKNLKIFECENCGSDFNIEENKKGDCSIHPGERELDENYVEGYHWLNYGEPWKSVVDSQYADRFIWNCCERNSDAEGVYIYET
ncbi:hypothetical protein BPAE_0337g00100 [Botrytis paeoniae]|uniref:C2H2-type domain-containing protein n=1 Tax=Botrytis paeoniae TaxID=278948 RepID=A0A4Z1F8K4_9HELO|nr:hypothetical protein BPAE_0337g00100 [Botrytis paeoniae]